MDALRELDDAIQAADHKQVIRAADKLLSANKEDVDALRCKQIALLQLGQAEEASSIQVVGSDFERSYALYAQRRYPQALEIIAPVAKQSKANTLLAAQIHYRMENYAAAHELFTLCDSSGSAELTCNLAAVAAMAPTPRTDAFIKSLNFSMYEQAYNASCYHINKKNYQQAIDALNAAIKVGESSMRREGASSHEIERELALCHVQLAYIHQIQRNTAEALKAYTHALKNIGDETAAAIAQSNMALIDSLPLDKAQHELDAANYNAFIASLNTLGASHVHRAGILASIVAVQELMGDSEGALRSIEAYLHWIAAADSTLQHRNLETIVRVFDKLSELKSKLGDRVSIERAEGWTNVLRKLVLNFPEERVFLALLANVSSNPQEIAKLAGQFAALGGGFDLDQLENLPAPVKKEKDAISLVKQEPRKKSGDEEKKKKKKKKKTKLPKNFDPSTQPNPERWLKKRDRSDYKPPKKRRGKDDDIRKGPQGMAVKEEDEKRLNAARKAQAQAQAASAQSAQGKNAKQPPAPKAKKSKRR